MYDSAGSRDDNKNYLMTCSTKTTSAHHKSKLHPQPYRLRQHRNAVRMQVNALCTVQQMGNSWKAARGSYMPTCNMCLSNRSTDDYESS